MEIFPFLFLLMASDTVPETESLPIYETSPTRAIIFSALFPGGGQIYTENYLKGMIFAGAEGLLLYWTI
ncbi:MAG: DUF5683 domain-containing protein, partial [candidate division WOR-3 bacterium]